MVVTPIAELVNDYQRYLQSITDDPEVALADAHNALITRDVLQDRWFELSNHQRELVHNLDVVLASKHEIVAEVLPSALSTDRQRWWWFLHEGLQVREEVAAGRSRS